MRDFMRRVLPWSCNSKKQEEEEEEEENNNNNKNKKSENFIRNGGELLQEYISFTGGGGRYYEDYDVIPMIPTYTAKELGMATQNFSHALLMGPVAQIYTGEIEGGRKILVIKTYDPSKLSREAAVRSIVIGSQMSHHKNVLRVIGCCLEFECQAPVYEYVHHHQQAAIILSDLLSRQQQQKQQVQVEGYKSFDWRSRVKVANDIARALVYLHTAFSTPIIFRDLKPSKVIILEDHSSSWGRVAKLFDFRFCVQLPFGELRVEQPIMGTFGFLDPEYYSSGYVTQKSDVYSFGVFLLVLITGKHAHGSFVVSPHYTVPLVNHAKQCVENGEYHKLIDPILLLQEGGVGGEDQDLVQSFVDLALMCTRHSGDDRPEMIYVARQLRSMERATRNRCHVSCQIE